MVERPKNETSRIPRSLLNRVANIAELLAVLSVVCVGAGCLGQFNFLLDLASHFRVQAICALAVTAGFIWIAGRRRRASVVLLTSVILASSLLPFFWPVHSPTEPSMRLLSMNVLTSNANTNLVIDYILDSDCDFVLLQETDSIWVRELEAALSERWPHRETIAREDNFGIAIYSKHAWSHCKTVVYEDDIQTPSLAAEFQLKGSDPLRLIATHAVPPMDRTHWRARNTLFARLAQDVATGQSDRTIVAGDLNCTPWSPCFRSLMNQSGLSNSSLGRGIGISWVPFGWKILGLPLDHVLVGSKIAVHERFVGPDLGSDHRPIIVEFK